ncbi:unnamed protein product [Trifolium pratense]|uniref:Uncharacterized protein n=1 Tax=Trifolium pratense TaxID=57577 RepID=A0ACB0IVB9_TRIPR|nr:unnamed protein product [Trifolium pratense]
MSVGITVEHPVPHVHTQNGLAESLIKRLQYIARPLIMRTKLPVTVWGHAILHAAALIRLRPSADHKHTPYQLAIAINVPARIDISKTNDVASTSKARLKRGRPMGSKDKHPRKRKETEKVNMIESDPEKTLDNNKSMIENCALEEAQNDDNEIINNEADNKNDLEISINYVNTGNLWSRKAISGFVIIAVYVDDLNIIGTNKEIKEARDYLKKEFEMKDLGKTKFCLGLQIEYTKNGILVHQSNYTERVLKRFNMDKANPLSTPMMDRTLNVEKDPFRPKEENETDLGSEVPYLSAIGALMYLANCTRPDIAFAVNLLARFSSCPTKRHWKGIKHIFRYLRGTSDLGLFYSNNTKPVLLGYADAGYLSDPHNAKSQTGYVFTYGDTTISWRSQKQTLVATSSNHAEVIALHEASKECRWLRSVTQHIQGTSGLPTD